MSARDPAAQGQDGRACLPTRPTAQAGLSSRLTPSIGTRVLRGLVRFYRLFFSAWLGAGCRYVPSCSQYAIDALERHGALGGSYLAAWRVLRCHPGCTGGRDEVPDHLARPRLFGHPGPFRCTVARRDADGPGAFNTTPPAHRTVTPGHPTPETRP